MSTNTPSPNFTPVELAHFKDLQTLFASLNTAARDPFTPTAALALLLPRIDTVAGEIQAMNDLALHRDTINLKAEADTLRPATTDLKQLKTELASYAKTTQALQDVAGALDQVLAAAQALGV
jgi:hypothetical protein